MASEIAMLARSKVLMMAALPPPIAPATKLGSVWLVSLVSAGLLYLAFFPVACGWLAWFALVPWLCLVRLSGRPRRRYLACWLGALAFYVPVLQWARVADQRMYITWLALALYCSLYLPLALGLLRRLDRRTRLPLVVTFPVVWVALEFLRWGLLGGFVALLSGSHRHDYPGGFSWYFLGHSQHDFLELIQVADLGSAYAVSFVVAAVNAALFEILYLRQWFRRLLLGESAERYGRTAILPQVLGVGVLLLGVLGYGVYRLREQTTTPGPLVALLQCNVDQRARNDQFGADQELREQARQNVRDHFKDLARQAARYRPDLIVTAETSYPGYWEEFAPGRPTHRSRQLGERIGAEWRTPLLLGMNAAVAGEDGNIHSYNSAILLDRHGVWQGRYDKIHRVPFGEYVPLRESLPILQRLAPYDFDYTVDVGEQFTRFPLATRESEYTFGVLICYEDTDPAMARPYASPPAVDFLLNISNDGWFNGTSEHDQHLALCRFRAVETRRSIGRAVNMGISAMIDSNGRVLAPKLVAERETIPIWEVAETPTSLPVPEWGAFKKIAGVLLARVPVDSRASPYAWWGDSFAAACGGLLLLTLAATARKRAKETAT